MSAESENPTDRPQRRVDADPRVRDLDDHYGWRQVYVLMAVDPDANRGGSP